MSLTVKSPQRAIQLVLLRPSRNEPSWEAMPIDVRQQVLRLLARMLREHVACARGEATLQEDRNE